MPHDAIMAMIVAFGSAAIIASPFLAIGVMVKMIRASKPPSGEMQKRIVLLEQELSAMRQEYAYMRETSTQHALSHDNNLDIMQSRLSFLERKLQESDKASMHINA